MKDVTIDLILSTLKQPEKVPRLAPIPFDHLKSLLTEVRKPLLADPNIIEIPAPVCVVGDIHGQFTDLLTFLHRGGSPANTTYLFLGDYVDRGHNSIESICYLLALKMKYPDHVFLLRGNHECLEMVKLYGFSEECEERYPGTDVLDRFVQVFDCLPFAAVIGQRIFCVHGGLGPKLTDGSISMIENVKRPIELPDDPMLAGENAFLVDVVWSDPDPEIQGYKESDRGAGYMFGKDVVKKFLEDNDFDLLCRAHQCVPRGFDFPFGDDQSTLTVFSAPNYPVNEGNRGAMLKVDSELRCSFEFVDPPHGFAKVGRRPTEAPSAGSS
jgi:serine/threonine-protein phosphatase PP1 catalytic subunit